MIKKIIACADIHIRNKDMADEEAEILTKFFEDIEKEMEGYERDEVRIVVAGDIFHSKLIVTNEGYMIVSWFLRKLSELAKVIVIAGNHDYSEYNIERVDCITAITTILDSPNIVYLDSLLDYASGYYEDDNVVWCLYSIFNKYSRPNIEYIKEAYPGKTRIGLIHGTVEGAKTDLGFMDENSLNKQIFKGLDFVIAGHIHKYQELKQGKVPIVYCSSMIQQNMGENVTGHGYVVWNIEDNTHEFKEIVNDNYGFYAYDINGLEDVESGNEKIVNN